MKLAARRRFGAGDRLLESCFTKEWRLSEFELVK